MSSFHRNTYAPENIKYQLHEGGDIGYYTATELDKKLLSKLQPIFYNELEKKRFLRSLRVSYLHEGFVENVGFYDGVLAGNMHFFVLSIASRIILRSLGLISRS